MLSEMLLLSRASTGIDNRTLIVDPSIQTEASHRLYDLHWEEILGAHSNAFGQSSSTTEETQYRAGIWQGPLNPIQRLPKGTTMSDIFLRFVL